jgi:protein-disulfide isomerase
LRRPCGPAGLTRRALLAAALAGGALPSHAEGWLALRDDAGESIEDMRLAVELVAVVDKLLGLMALGPDVPFVRMVEFFDYNFSICQCAAPGLETLVRTDRDLGVMLVHNPILAPTLRVAAAHAIATRHGQDLALRFHAGMFSRPGPVSPSKLQVATARIGLDLGAVAREAEAMSPAVKTHTDLAAALGFAATPSFILGSVDLLGYPGPTAMRLFTLAAAQCGDVVCP